MSCEIEAKVLAYSVGEDAPPLPTFQLRYPLQIHAELMTHRVFSRNARSSRAVPTARLLDEVRERPFIPRYWGANQKGMQATEECSAPVVIGFGSDDFVFGTNEEAWLLARDNAANMAQAFANAGYHKQVANRLLAPFLHIDVVLTTTELSNWFALRDDKAAEPHIRDLAVAMREALTAAGDPVLLRRGEWHLPYVDDGTKAVIGRETPDNPEGDWGEACLHTARAVSVTRCAQVSYTPFHEAKLSVEQEVARHDTLISARPCHASPLEHQATPDCVVGQNEKGEPIWEHPELHGNLKGWKQYRKYIPHECA